MKAPLADRCCRTVLYALLAWSALSRPATAETPRIPVLVPGPELERLDFLLGSWSGSVTRYRPDGSTFEVHSTLETTRTLGDAWIESRDRTELGNGIVIHSRTLLTWDARAKSYVGSWLDNVFAGQVRFEGRWMDDRRLDLDTGDFEFLGRPHRVTFSYAGVSEDEFTVEMRQAWDGAEPRTVATGRFERVKAVPNAHVPATSPR